MGADAIVFVHRSRPTSPRLQGIKFHHIVVPTVNTEWGGITGAQRVLIGAALEHNATGALFLSDTCIPLVSFSRFDVGFFENLWGPLNESPSY